MLSIVIVSWNSEEYIEGCLGSLNSNYDIILMDNASEDRTVEIVKEKFPWVRVIQNSYNAGLSRATNQGAKLARGDYILLLNPDVIVMENAIHKLCEFADNREDVGGCGPRFLSPTGKIQPSCREFPGFKNLFLEFTGIGRLKKSSSWKMGYFNHTSMREVEQPMGSCLLIRKKVFDEIGGMNERYPMFMNDVDLCYRIKNAGYKLYFLPEANVIHYLGSSTRKVRRKMILEEHRSIYRYLKDHFSNRFLVGLYGFLLLTGAFYRILFSFLTRKNIYSK